MSMVNTLTSTMVEHLTEHASEEKDSECKQPTATQEEPGLALSGQPKRSKKGLTKPMSAKHDGLAHTSKARPTKRRSIEKKGKFPSTHSRKVQWESIAYTHHSGEPNNRC